MKDFLFFLLFFPFLYKLTGSTHGDAQQWQRTLAPRARSAAVLSSVRVVVYTDVDDGTCTV